MSVGPKKDHDVFSLIAETCHRLREAGFERANVSMKSETVYFRFPGRHGVLRVSAHRSKNKMIGLDHVVAQIIFHGNRIAGPAILWCTDNAVEALINHAVGRYMMNSVRPHAPKYRGKKGTWEQATRTHVHTPT